MVHSASSVRIRQFECRFEISFRGHRSRLLSICDGFLCGFFHQLIHAYAERRHIQFWCICFDARLSKDFDGASFFIGREP